MIQAVRWQVLCCDAREKGGGGVNVSIHLLKKGGKGEKNKNVEDKMAKKKEDRQWYNDGLRRMEGKW